MKNILLIGGSKGIGRALIDMLLETNKIHVLSRTNEGLPNHSNVIHQTFDATKDSLSSVNLPEHIHGWVYLPGSINLRPFKGLKLEVFEADFQLNVLHMIRLLQESLPKLTAVEQSSIVLYSTVAVKIGMPFHSSVSMAKGAIEGFARALAAEYAPKIRVNVVAPSLTDTSLAEKFLNNDLKKEKAGERHPLKRVGDAKDIASMTAFLLSEQSSWMTGQILHVDGGMSSLQTGA
jgi:3-oxoacyl-[acyl-carrier protein] reductase